MMKHYLEFTLSGNKKTPVPVLMSSLLNQVHHALVKLGTTQIGVSFPRYDITLGNVLRLHGEAHLLKLFVLNVDKFESGISVSDIRPVPESVSHACFYRVRPSKQNSKLQAGIKSGHITDPKSYIVKMCQETIDAPFFQSKSTSTNQSYRRFVGRMDIETPIEGVFDTFGLSKTASVPVF